MIRYLVGVMGEETIVPELILAMVLAGLGTLPQSANAQAGGAATAAEPNLQEPAPSSEPASEGPALQLELTPAGVDVAPGPPRTFDGYTLEETDVRVRRAKIGLGSSAAALFAGGMFLGLVAVVTAGSISASEMSAPPNQSDAARLCGPARLCWWVASPG